MSDNEVNKFSTQYANLADPRLGAKIEFVTDDFFAEASRMLNAAPAQFIAGKFDDNGKWMDGWESRRKRGEGYDSCIVKLGQAGVIKGVDIDTSYFCGNHPPAASIEACNIADNATTNDDTQWTEVLSSVNLQQDSHHLFDIVDTSSYTHLRLNIYPDGGIARLRVYGEPCFDWDEVGKDSIIDLASLQYGGRAIAASNQAFGSSIVSLNLPGRGINMGDGWETARRREPGNEWVIIKLGHAGTITAIELDTAHYKGNFPDSCLVQAGFLQGGDDSVRSNAEYVLANTTARTKMQMDAIHHFEKELENLGPVTHVRVNIVPDGGLSRVRVFGKI